MNNYIAAGFQNTVDFELEWDLFALERLVRENRIVQSEIRQTVPIRSVRDLVVTLLYHMSRNTGSECLAVSSRITREFAGYFRYQITLGGTAVRAAMAIEKIGYRSVIHACSLNHYFRELIPSSVRWISSVPDEGDDFHPHVILQYPAHVRVHVNDIDFITERPNRVIFAYDPPSVALNITDAFAGEVGQAGVFLAASFNIIKDPDILRKRLNTTIDIIRHLPEKHVVLMEDACFENPVMQQTVAAALSPYLDIFSMNEDELQERLGHPIDVMDAAQVADAIQSVYSKLRVPTVICHSAFWALAYGKEKTGLRQALADGVCMASTRFRLGDQYGREDYLETSAMPSRTASVAFARELERLLPGTICVPGKDMDDISSPVTIGLGDSFIGGMLPAFLTEEQRKLAEK